MDEIRHPSRLPPQTRIEDTVLDIGQGVERIDDAVGWLAKACASRFTTPMRLLDAMAQRKKLRWRAELSEALADVAGGCHSLLERRYLHDVERAHDLPVGLRQQLTRSGQRTTYDDVRYDGVLIELDGRVAHPRHARWRDLRRDNASTVSGARVLRYGWSDVTERPCVVAAQVVAALRLTGWSGQPRSCGHPA